MMSPPYAGRVLLPHQPRPPQHWPEECAEVMSHAWLRVWKCPTCGREWAIWREEAEDLVGISCFGDSMSFVREP